jgi:hypothetical protein
MFRKYNVAEKRIFREKEGEGDYWTRGLWLRSVRIWGCTTESERYRACKANSFVWNRLEDITKNCLEPFRLHWECLEQNNQQLWQCRRKEMKLNQCVFEKLVAALALSYHFLYLSCSQESECSSDSFPTETRKDDTWRARK